MTAEFTPMNHRGNAIVLVPIISYTTGQMLVLLLGISLITSYGYDCENCDWWRWMFVGTQFTCFTSTQVQMLPLPALPEALPPPAPAHASAQQVLSLLALRSRLLTLLALRPARRRSAR